MNQKFPSPIAKSWLWFSGIVKLSRSVLVIQNKLSPSDVSVTQRNRPSEVSHTSAVVDCFGVIYLVR